MATETEDDSPTVALATRAAEPDASPDDVPLTDAEQEPTPSPWFGRIIDDRYRIVELLGEGGMGTVFIAEHMKLRKIVALKTIHPSFLGNEEVAARFAREAMASAQLEHPHVASAMDYGSLPEGGAYLVLELVRGPSLRAQIEKQGAARWDQVCEIGAQIADALSAAHAMGIVHRDLKPENVLLEARHGGAPIVKVLDFGIARVRDGDAQGPEAAKPARALTQVGAVMGTPGYMAPEQAVGDVVDERADLYALGVILWEMLAGRCLFDAPNLTGILTQQFGTTPSARLTQGTVSVPPELAELLDKLLAPIPKDRIASAAEVRDVLRSLASRDVAGDTGLYRIAIPTAVRKAAPKLRTAFHTALAGASPRLGALWAKVAQHCGSLWGKAPPGVRAWARRVQRWLGKLPRNVAWAGGAATLIVVVSFATAAAIVEPDETSPPGSNARHTAAVVSQSAREPTQVQSDSSQDREVQSHVDTLSQSRNRKERRTAARWLQKPPAKTEVPPFAKALARLELGPDCQARVAALRRLRTLSDPRALAAVTYWYNKPRRGCGFRENRDCYVCLRDDLRKTQRALQSENDERTASR